MPPGGSTPIQRGGAESKVAHKWAGGYISPAASGVHTASERGAESKVAHKWAWWLHNPCLLGGPHRLKKGGQNQRWPTSGTCGYTTPATWGVPAASKREAQLEVAHK